MAEIVKEAEGLATDSSMAPSEIVRNESPLKESSLTNAGMEITGRQRMSDPGEDLFGSSVDATLGNAIEVVQIEKGESSGPSAFTAPTREEKSFAESGAASLYSAMWGLGTDESVVFHQLEGLSARQLDLLKQVFKENYGQDLEQRLRAELSGSDQARALAALTADPVESAAARLHHALKGFGAAENTIISILTQKDAAAVIARFDEKYATKHGEQNLRATFAAEGFSQEFARRLEYLQRAAESDSPEEKIRNRALADTIVLAEGLKKGIFSGDAATVESVLRNYRTVEDRAILEDAYAEVHVSELRQAIERSLSADDARKATALLDGDAALVKALALKEAVGVFNCDISKVRSLLEGTSHHEREEIRDRFKEIIDESGIEAALQNRVRAGSPESHCLKSLLANGSVSAADNIMLAINGIGTNERVLRSELVGRTKAQIEHIGLEFKLKYNCDLTERVLAEVSGSDRFDIKEALQGVPETPEDTVAAMERRQKFETSGALSRLTSYFTVTDNLMNERLEEAKSLQRQLSSTTVSERAVLEAELRAVYESQLLHAHGFRKCNSTIADKTALAATMVTATGVTIASGGTATGLAFAAVSAVAARSGVKYGFKGESYSAAEAATDTGLAVMEVATAKVGLVAVNALSKTKVFSALSSYGKVGRVAQGASEAAADGTAGGALGGAAEAAMNGETWDGGLRAGLQNVLTSGAIGAVAGGAGGGLLAPGMQKVGGATSAGVQRVRKGLESISIHEQLTKQLAAAHSGVQVVHEYAKKAIKSVAPDMKRAIDEVVSEFGEESIGPLTRSARSEVATVAMSKGGSVLEINAATDLELTLPAIKWFDSWQVKSDELLAIRIDAASLTEADLAKIAAVMKEIHSPDRIHLSRVYEDPLEGMYAKNTEFFVGSGFEEISVQAQRQGIPTTTLEHAEQQIRLGLQRNKLIVPSATTKPETLKSALKSVLNDHRSIGYQAKVYISSVEQAERLLPTLKQVYKEIDNPNSLHVQTSTEVKAELLKRQRLRRVELLKELQENRRIAREAARTERRLALAAHEPGTIKEYALKKVNALHTVPVTVSTSTDGLSVAVSDTSLVRQMYRDMRKHMGTNATSGELIADSLGIRGFFNPHEGRMVVSGLADTIGPLRAASQSFADTLQNNGNITSAFSEMQKVLERNGYTFMLEGGVPAIFSLRGSQLVERSRTRILKELELYSKNVSYDSIPQSMRVATPHIQDIFQRSTAQQRTAPAVGTAS